MKIARTRDEGFTLVELLLAVVILGIIIGPLIAAILVILQNVTTTEDRLSASHDVQIANAYFAADVKSSGSQLHDPVTDTLVRKPVSTSSTPTCARTTSTSDVLIVAFSWRDIPYDPNNPVAVDPASQFRNRWAWYYLARPKKSDGTADLSKQATLRRGYCSVVDGATTAYTDTPIERFVSPGAVPSVTCVGGCTSDYPTSVTIKTTLGLDASRSFYVQATRRVTQ
jgi:prepilin-type N-terminal cleavage/methylation domain-containing protein